MQCIGEEERQRVAGGPDTERLATSPPRPTMTTREAVTSSQSATGNYRPDVRTSGRRDDEEDEKKARYMPTERDEKDVGQPRPYESTNLFPMALSASNEGRLCAPEARDHYTDDVTDVRMRDFDASGTPARPTGCGAAHVIATRPQTRAEPEMTSGSLRNTRSIVRGGVRESTGNATAMRDIVAQPTGDAVAASESPVTAAHHDVGAPAAVDVPARLRDAAVPAMGRRASDAKTSTVSTYADADYLTAIESFRFTTRAHDPDPVSHDDIAREQALQHDIATCTKADPAQ